MKTKKEIKKSFFAVIKALWEKPKADVFYIQNYAWDWVEEAIEEALKQQKKEMVEKFKDNSLPSEKTCELYTDHTIIWDGNNYTCSHCGEEFIPIKNVIKTLKQKLTK